MIIALRLDKVNSLNQNSKKKTCKFVQCNRKTIHRMFKNTIKQFLYVTLQEKANAINILGKYVYCAGGSIARNSGAVNKKLTIQGECVKAIPHNSKCRYGERGTAAAKPKAQIILDAAKVSAASGGNSEPKQGQRSQSARGFCPRSTMRVPQPDIIEHFGNADAVPQSPERCLSRQAGIVRYCLKKQRGKEQNGQKNQAQTRMWHRGCA